MSMKQSIGIVAVTRAAWSRMHAICKDNSALGFVYAAESGGCSGLNYKLSLLHDESELDKMGTNGKLPMSYLEENGTRVFVDPLSEMFLVGSQIDFVEQDVANNVFDSKFVFSHEKGTVFSCGCGTSFMPKSSPAET
jgi:iron-sulfur cluster assembly protein